MGLVLVTEGQLADSYIDTEEFSVSVRLLSCKPAFVTKAGFFVAKGGIAYASNKKYHPDSQEGLNHAGGKTVFRTCSR